MNIQEIIQKAEQEAMLIKASKTNQRIYVDIEKKDFIKLFDIQVKAMLSRKNNSSSFNYDNNNKEIVQQLFFWLSNNSEFKGNLQKGILLVGNIGSGKTLIIESFIRLYNLICEVEKKIRIHDSRQLFYKLTEDGIGDYINQKMFIDDLGKEPLEFTHFGYTKQPMVELLTERHSKGILTFATGNYRIEDYGSKIYNETISDRLKEMFNIFILKGDSKR
jgi:DNA replication protein DnaC